MDSFIIVRPTGKPAHEAIGKWVQSEMDRAIHQWRKEFHGEARVKDDTAITDEDIASANLILWGDPNSNALIKRIAEKLPIHWDADNVTVDQNKYSAADHVPVMIYPNPLNPKRYVVLNSGFTFREADYINCARLVPRLPDWAVIDMRTPPDSNSPGKIETADFFGEQWQLHPTHQEQRPPHCGHFQFIRRSAACSFCPRRQINIPRSPPEFQRPIGTHPPRKSPTS